jgi:hypothetical protein
MEVSTERREMRIGKLEHDFKILYHKSIKPAMNEFMEMVRVSGLKAEKKKISRDSEFYDSAYKAVYKVTVDKPYLEVNFEIGINENMDGFEIWIDMEDEYSQWTELVGKPISKLITGDELLKEAGAGLDKALALTKEKESLQQAVS